MNQHWPRWIFASISKHFDDRKGNLPLYIEGQLRQPGVKDLLELRIDGPYLTEESRNYWRLYVEVSVIVQSTMDAHDYHRIHRNCGFVASLFTAIPLYKLGDSVDDNPTEQFGCLSLVQDIGKRERIQINHFGKIDPATDLLQSSVEAHYVTHLTA